MIYQPKKIKGIILTYFFVAQLGGVLLIPLFMLLIPNSSETLQLGLSMIISFLIGLSLILFLMRHDIKEMKKEKMNIKKIVLYGVGGSVTGVLVQTLLIPIVTLLSNEVATNENEKMLTEMAQINLMFILIPTIIGPILEEIVFRYGILGSLMKRINTVYAVIISSLIFGFMHWDFTTLSSLPFVIVYTGMGVVFALVYLRSRSLLSAIVAHVIMNSLVMILYLLGIS